MISGDSALSGMTAGTMMNVNKCQVIFFPLLYEPTPYEKKRLQHVQDMITNSRQELRWKARDAKDLLALESAFLNRFRYNLEIVDGHLEFQ